jgi:hypothetical protein
MKQKGKEWKDAKGVSIPDKYITKLQRLEERNGQQIASLAKDLEQRLRAAKVKFVMACIEVFRNSPDAEKSKNNFTFYTFDREFRIEWTSKENYVRVYEATRPNPTAKDYRLLDLNLAAIKVNSNTMDTTTIPAPDLKDSTENFEDAASTTTATLDNPDEMQEEENLVDLQGSADNDTGTSGPLLSGQN